MDDQLLLSGKKIACLVIAVALLGHGVRLWKEGSDSCSGLLGRGWWRSNEIWQPYGCTIHRYKTSEAAKCLSEKRVSFVGDSRARDFFQYLKARVSDADPEGVAPMHHDLQFSPESSGVNIKFHWLPVVNEDVYKLYESFTKDDKAPDFILHSAALWHVKILGSDHKVVTEFQANLTKLSQTYYSKLDNSTVVWLQQYPLVEFLVEADPQRRGRYSNKLLAEYDTAAEHALKGSNVKILKSFREAVAQRFPQDTSDGMHYSGKSMKLGIDLILNILCNNQMKPQDATCCISNRVEMTLIQLFAALFFLSCSVAAFVVRLRINTNKQVNSVDQSNSKKEDSSLHNVYVVLWNLSKFGFILAYFFICDRTPIFMKEAKEYNSGLFFACLVVFFLIGICTAKEASKGDYLNRDQTDEWKGWMQLVILAYHYLGASQDLQVYVWVRVIVAAYLFMSAYGHFNYFWNKGDYSLFRFSQVMLRMNLLTVLLSYIMDRPYQFYYFVPLVSFYFIIVYLTHLVWPQVDASKAKGNVRAVWIMIIKISLLAVMCFFLWKSQTFFSQLFSWWPFVELFRAGKEYGVREWWFRSGLDRFMAPFGMLFALLVLLAKNFKWINTDFHQLPFNRLTSWLLLIASSAIILSYGYFSVTCPSKPECNSTHSWLSFLPVLGFVFLRNVPVLLRSRYSVSFAWMGKISLELFIGQYHIWLANDTHSILVLIPGYPFINAIITTFVFVCAAHEISSICGVLTSYAVTKDAKSMAKRIVVLLLVFAVTLLVHELVREL
eukprot:m.131172 g.131172  ORF g.131172 m.131172 type:complete len:778 (+) comp38040_c0_seq18:156-2489(+)